MSNDYFSDELEKRLVSIRQDDAHREKLKESLLNKKRNWEIILSSEKIIPADLLEINNTQDRSLTFLIHDLESYLPVNVCEIRHKGKVYSKKSIHVKSFMWKATALTDDAEKLLFTLTIYL